MPDSFFMKKGPGGIPQGVLIIGGTVAVAGIYFYRKQKAAAATPATQTATTPVDATGYSPSDLGTISSVMQPPVPVSVGGSTPTGTGTTPPPTPYSPPSGETLVGSGYGPPPGSNTVVANDQHTYQSLTQSQAQQLRSAGKSIYYQVLPGVFIPIGNTQLLPNTSQWMQQN